MLLAVLGHLGDADRDLLAGMAAAGDSAYAVVLDVADLGPHRPARAAGDRGAAQRRLEGHHARARDGSLAAAWHGAGPMTASDARRPTGRRRVAGCRAWRPGRRCSRWPPAGSRCSPGAGWSTEPLTFLIADAAGRRWLMALAGSGLRVVRVPPYVVALVQVARRRCSALNLIFAARAVAARRDPDRGRRCAQVVLRRSATARRR